MKLPGLHYELLKSGAGKHDACQQKGKEMDIYNQLSLLREMLLCDEEFDREEMLKIINSCRAVIHPGERITYIDKLGAQCSGIKWKDRFYTWHEIDKPELFTID